MKALPPPFLVDENLRGLARWLRFLGLDTALASGQPDRELERWAHTEKRLLLTRDRALAGSVGSARAHFLKASRTREQLQEIFQTYLWPPQSQWFTRCSLCNENLRELTPTEFELLPADFKEGWICPSCGRVYWRGSHYVRTRAYLEEWKKQAAADEHSSSN